MAFLLFNIFQNDLVTSLSLCMLSCESGRKTSAQSLQGLTGLLRYSNSVLLPYLGHREWRLQGPNPNSIIFLQGLCDLGQVTSVSETRCINSKGGGGAPDARLSFQPPSAPWRRCVLSRRHGPHSPATGAPPRRSARFGSREPRTGHARPVEPLEAASTPPRPRQRGPEL